MAGDLTVIFAALPKPTSMSFNYPKDWASEESGVFGALADKNWVGAAKTLGLNVLSDFTNNQGIAAAQAKTGKTMNKRNVALFRDLPFREVSFSWVLRPRNQKKAAMYMRLINKLKVNSAPTLAWNGAVFDVNATIWALTIKTKIAEQPGDILFRSKELVIKDIAVNYAPNGFWSQHADGYPTQIDLSLTLMELELATRDRLRSDSNPDGLV